jgi:hypothetical protein
MRNMNRRAVMASAAALPALTLPAIAFPAQVDPIFAAIEEHRSLNVISDAAFAAVARKDNAPLPEIFKAEEFAGDRQGEAYDQMAEILAMTPTTAAGCIAMLHYLGEFMQNCENECAPFHNWESCLREPAAILYLANPTL